MNHLKITSVIMSVVMCASLVLSPVAVMADDTVPSEAEATEAVETSETEEEKKEEPAETQKETEAAEEKEPEATEEPAETEKQEPAETEKEPEESKEPETTEKKAPDASEKTDPKDAISGKCGDKINWHYNTSTKTLSLKGSGAMYSFDHFEGMNTEGKKFAPWIEHTKDIKTIEIENQITNIGMYAFEGCKNLTSVTILQPARTSVLMLSQAARTLLPLPFPRV